VPLTRVASATTRRAPPLDRTLATAKNPEITKLPIPNINIAKIPVPRLRASFSQDPFLKKSANSVEGCAVDLYQSRLSCLSSLPRFPQKKKNPTIHPPAKKLSNCRTRSEERRVGKEWSTRWWEDYEK